MERLKRGRKHVRRTSPVSLKCLLGQSGCALSSKRRGTDTHTPTSTPLIPVPVRDDSLTQDRARYKATKHRLLILGITLYNFCSL